MQGEGLIMDIKKIKSCSIWLDEKDGGKQQIVKCAQIDDKSCYVLTVGYKPKTELETTPEQSEAGFRCFHLTDVGDLDGKAESEGINQEGYVVNCLVEEIVTEDEFMKVMPLFD